jgi:hypothetical protein
MTPQGHFQFIFLPFSFLLHQLKNVFTFVCQRLIAIGSVLIIFRQDVFFLRTVQLWMKHLFHVSAVQQNVEERQVRKLDIFHKL